MCSLNLKSLKMTYFRLKYLAAQLDKQTVVSNKESHVEGEKDFAYSQDSYMWSLPGY